MPGTFSSPARSCPALQSRPIPCAQPTLTYVHRYAHCIVNTTTKEYACLYRPSGARAACANEAQKRPKQYCMQLCAYHMHGD